MIFVINRSKIDAVMHEVEEDSEYVQQIVDGLVSKCCDNLTDYINYVSKILNDNDYSLTNDELDDIIMTIPTMLYYVGEQQERLGIKQDVSDTTRSFMYNKLFAESTGTVDHKKAVTESALFDETLVTVIYARAYNTIKSKVSTAMELLQSAKKIMSRRITEAELNKVAPNVFDRDRNGGD